MESNIIISYQAIALFLSVVNAITLIGVAVWYFKSNYTIVDLVTWNKVVTKYNQVLEAETDNCGGGSGFFRECLEEEEIEENE